MSVFLFVTHFFKRKSTYSSLFSTAISEGIRDVFQEMGYSVNRVNKQDTQGNVLSKEGQSMSKENRL